ncbi:DUF3995 domain-containing protein [Microbacterium sp. 22179]|uniref:DUF3995 domain-containing protein n=1 Tax=Microbacterium sp. 22179 TaxID=3453886 RepID=UPI003F86D865
MHSGVRLLARVVGATGLASIAALHAIWASGSPWPATSSEELAEAVVGQSVEMPSAAPTAVVAAGAAGAALLTAGALGSGRPVRLALHGIAAAFLARALLGGGAALTALRLPPAGTRFRRLDARWYRPFSALMGISLWVSTPSSRGRIRRGAGTRGS